MREKFTASVWERLIIVLIDWKSCGTHRSAVVCKGLWEWRSYCSPNQNSKVAEAATRLSVLLTLTLISSYMLAQQNADINALNPVAFT